MKTNNEFCIKNVDMTQNKNNKLKEILEFLFIIPMWLIYQTSNKALSKFKETTTLTNKLAKYSAIPSNSQKQCLSYITSEDAPIFIVKGYHDYLTAILLNSANKSFSAPFNVHMISDDHYKFNSNEILLLTGKDVYFLPDNNMQSIKIFTELAEQIKDISDDVAVIHLAKFLKEYNDGHTEKKLNLSIAVSEWKDKDSYSFVNLLINYSDTRLKFNKGSIV